MVKKEKKKEKPVKDESDDGIDLQSLISSLKEQSSNKEATKETPVEVVPEEPTEDKSEAAFELVEEEKEQVEETPKSVTEKKTSILDSLPKIEETRKSKSAPGISDEERRRFDEERKAFADERRRFEEERNALEDERRTFEEERKGHTENRSKTEEELKNVGTELLRKKEAIAKLEEQVKKKDAEQREKEKNIKKATDLLLSQRQTLSDKEKKLDSVKEELTKKAEDLKVREEKLSTVKDRTAELDAREIRIRELEAKLKEKELHHKAMEDEMASCPRCSSKDRFLSIEHMIEELKEFGLVDETAERDLKEMRGLIDSGQNDKAIEIGDKLIHRLKELKDGVLAKGIMYLLASTDKNLKHAKEVGGFGDRVADVERWLAQAKELISKEEYKTAEYYIKEADFMLQSITRGVPTTTPPTTETVAPPESVSRNYTCPSCSTTFTVDTMERPVRITCPGCQIELIIKEDVSFS